MSDDPSPVAGADAAGGSASVRPWRPRVTRTGEAEVEIVWWAPVQLVLALLLAAATLVTVVLLVTQLAAGQIPVPAAVVVGLLGLAGGVATGWMLHHRQVRLRLDSAGLTHRDRLGGFTVGWQDLRRVELIDGRGGTRLHLTADAPLARSGRRERDLVVVAGAVPAIARAVEHWTGHPILVRAAGTTVAWRPDDGGRTEDRELPR